MKTQLTIGQVAKEVGMSAKTIRYYEEIELLQTARRMDNNYRAYSSDDINRLQFIKQARRLGLTIIEIKQLVQESFGGTCEHLRERLLAQLPRYTTSVEKRIHNLQELKKKLDTLQHDLQVLYIPNPKKRVVDCKQCKVLENFR